MANPAPLLRSRQGQALFGLLVLRHDSEIDREWLAFALWPDSSETQARYNLRRNLTDLRHFARFGIVAPAFSLPAFPASGFDRGGRGQRDF